MYDIPLHSGVSLGVDPRILGLLPLDLRQSRGKTRAIRAGKVRYTGNMGATVRVGFLRLDSGHYHLFFQLQQYQLDLEAVFSRQGPGKVHCPSCDEPRLAAACPIYSFGG